MSVNVPLGWNKKKNKRASVGKFLRCKWWKDAKERAREKEREVKGSEDERVKEAREREREKVYIFAG